MAQTKRKRKTKHRGTAGGTVIARGRTGRKLTPEEKKEAGRRPGAKAGGAAPRAPRYAQPPTWKGSLKRAALVTAVFVVLLLLFKSKPAGIVAILPFVLVIYTAIGYYMDRMMHRRWLRKQGPR